MFRSLDHRPGHYLVLLAVTAALYLPGLGTPSLWDIDEGHNAEAAREMLERGNWIVPQFNYQLRVDKPVLLYWLQGAAYQIFGVNEFAARLPAALAALFTVLVSYELGRRLFDSAAALLGALILASSMLFTGTAHFANPDSLLNACTTLTFFLFWDGFSRGSSSWMLWAGLSTGLGLLAKGPVAVVLPAAVIGVFLLASGQLRRLLSSRLLLGLLMCALVALPWYALVGSETKGEFLRGFFLKHNKDRFLTSLEGHSGPIFYHLGSLVVGFLPWSVLLAPALYYGWRRKVDCGTQNAECGTNAASPHSACYMPHSSRFLFCWIGVYLVFFSLSQTKLPSYILPIYPAVALLTGQFLQGWRHGVFEPPRWVMPVSLALFGLVGVGLTAGLLVAAGIIAMPGRVYQDLPGLEQFAGLGTLPVLGAAGATWSLILRERRAVLACIVTSGLLFVAMLALCTGRALDGHKAPRALVDAAGARQLDRDIRIGCYEWYQPSLVFYCQREVTTFYFEREALEFLQSPLPVYLFLPAQNWQQIEAKAEGPWHLVARHRCLYRNCEVVVVTNEK